MVNGATISKPVARSLVLENYDPRQRNPKNDIRILITTDVLAEGVNLTVPISSSITIYRGIERGFSNVLDV